jgi:hypothetical protein
LALLSIFGRALVGGNDRVEVVGALSIGGKSFGGPASLTTGIVGFGGNSFEVLSEKEAVVEFGIVEEPESDD